MRILILSDIHANLVALETVLRNAGDFDQIWCLGDIVGYGPEPNACVETLRGYDLVCVAGNHDWAVLDQIDLEDFNPDARRAVLWTREQLQIQNLDWLHALPDNVPPLAEQFTVVHGSPRSPIWEYVLTPAVARINFEYLDTPICLVGHTHVPVLYRYHEDHTATAELLPEDVPISLDSARLMINPGSVGQPRDGDARAAFALLDLEMMTLTHHRIEYNILATQLKMGQAQLPMRLITRLSYGW